METRSAPRMAWRVVVLVGVVLAVGFGAVGLYQGQRSEIEAARADRQAHWWWYGAIASLALTVGFLPLSATWPRRRGGDDFDPDDA
jgi:hypothetical protein